MRQLAASLATLLLCLGASAQPFPFGLFDFGRQQEEPKTRKTALAYDVNFDFKFDNRDFARTEGLYTSSGTLFQALATPSIGIDIMPDSRLSHRVMAGIDIAKNLGESPALPGQEKLQNLGLFREITLYYRIRYVGDKTIITGYAGILPRRFMQGEYSSAFFSDSLLVRDRNIEGALLTIQRPRAMYEFGCDWMGMKGPSRRERFMLFTTGEAFPVDWFSLGWALTGYHYACADEYGQVADNILAEPFVKFSLGSLAGMQDLTAKLSFLGGLQRRRDISMDFSVPYGGQLRLLARNWNVGIDNTTYVGTSQMPFYNDIDDGGYKFGSQFYYGNPMYRIHASGAWNSIGWYDRAEVFYAPRIAGFLDLKISLVFHLTGDASAPFRYAGWQQKLSLVFDLDRLLHQTKKLTKEKRKIYHFDQTL